MPFNVANALQTNLPDPIGIDQLKRRNALADRDQQLQESNALAQQDYYKSQQQNMLRDDARSEEAAQATKLKEWAGARIEHVRQNPALIPQVIAEGKQLGLLHPDMPDNLPPEKLEELAMQLGIGPRAQFDQTSEYQQMVAEYGFRDKQADQAAENARRLAAIQHAYGLSEIEARAIQERETQARKGMSDDPGTLVPVPDASGVPVYSTRRDAVGKPVPKTGAAPGGVNTAWSMYQEARKGLTGALAGTETGPIIGRAPSFTAAQQTAEGAVSAMAPVLKQIFRVAGEGTFTDKDQELLLRMVPTRTDRPEARNAKLANIDNIIKAKLGVSEPGTPAQGGAPVKVRSLQEARSLPPGTVFVTPDGRQKVR